MLLSKRLILRTFGSRKSVKKRDSSRSRLHVCVSYSEQTIGPSYYTLGCSPLDAVFEIALHSETHFVIKTKCLKRITFWIGAGGGGVSQRKKQ